MHAPRLWLSAAEIAAAALPGLPRSAQGVNLRAEAEGWKASGKARKRAGRGGGWEYHVSLLPEEARAPLGILEERAGKERAVVRAVELGRPKAVGVVKGFGFKAKALPAPAGKAPAPKAEPKDEREAGLARLGALPPEARAQVEARALLLDALEAWAHPQAISSGAALEAFAAELAAGASFGLPPERLAALGGTPSAATLARWRRLRASGGAAALMDGRAGRKIGGGLSPDAETLMKAVIAKHPDCAAPHVRSVLRDLLAPQEPPSLKMIQRALAAWRREDAGFALMLSNPDAFKGRVRVAPGSRSEGIVRPCQRVEMDSTSAELELSDGKRYALIAALDVATRRAMLLVAPTSSGAAVAACLRRVILEWGVPEEVKTDNGADYVSAHVRLVLKDLGIVHTTCDPFSPEQKPHVERFFRTFLHGVFEMLPGFKGHNVAEAQAIRNRESFAERMRKKTGEGEEPIKVRLTPQQLQALCDDWRLGPEYGLKVHSALGCSPLQKAAELGADKVKRIGDEHALDMLLMSMGTRKAGKGRVNLDGGTYHAARLMAWQGQSVQVRRDPADAGRVWVASEAGEFIAWAVDPARAGIDRATFAAQTRHEARAIEKDWRAEGRAMKRGAAKLRVVPAPAPALAAPAAPAVAPIHITPALKTGAEAARALEAAPPPALRTDITPERAAAAFAPKAKAAIAEDRERYHRWAEFQARRAQGEAVDEAEVKRWANYAKDSEAVSLTKLIKQFGYAAIIGKPDPRRTAA